MQVAGYCGHQRDRFLRAGAEKGQAGPGAPVLDCFLRGFSGVTAPAMDQADCGSHPWFIPADYHPAVHGIYRHRDPAGNRSPRYLQPDPGRPAGPGVPHLQVPQYAPGRRKRWQGPVGFRQRQPGYPGWRIHPQHPARRTATDLQRDTWGYEHCRPERPEFVSELREKIPYYDTRHYVRPGLMGWAQLKYPYGASVEDARGKLEYDLYYSKTRSLLMDFLIMIQTAEVVLLGKGVR